MSFGHIYPMREGFSTLGLYINNILSLYTRAYGREPVVLGGNIIYGVYTYPKRVCYILLGVC